ncbi:MAG: hypothetical protein GF350_01565 [Chitinivibrionales bacterium]|nr:hypothetical protein [Chitinivibrionales bacterium]
MTPSSCRCTNAAMKLRLFKDLYRDPMKEGVVRLLFEGIHAPLEKKERFNDFYIYVWIDSGNALESFQAVLDDEIVLEARKSGAISFGQIVTEPFNRTIKVSKSLQKRKRMVRIMANLRNEYFPDLIKEVGRIVREDRVIPVKLSDEERKVFEKLM